MMLASVHTGQLRKFAKPMQLLLERHITGPADGSNPSLSKTQ